MPRGKKADFFGAIRAQAAPGPAARRSGSARSRRELTELRGQPHQWRQLPAKWRTHGGDANGPGVPGAARSGGKRVQVGRGALVPAETLRRRGRDEAPARCRDGTRAVYPALNPLGDDQGVRRVGKGVSRRPAADSAAPAPRTRGPERSAAVAPSSAARRRRSSARRAGALHRPHVGRLPQAVRFPVVLVRQELGELKIATARPL